MLKGVRGSQLRQIQALCSVGTFAGLGDGPLLERFATLQGEVAELAFAALVRGTGQWSGASAGASCATSTMRRTRSRPPGWSWCARPARSATPARWVTGCSGWPRALRSTPGSRRRGASFTSSGTPRAIRTWHRQRIATGMTLARCFTKSSSTCRNDTGHRSCFATSKD